MASPEIGTPSGSFPLAASSSLEHFWTIDNIEHLTFQAACGAL